MKPQNSKKPSLGTGPHFVETLRFFCLFLHFFVFVVINILFSAPYESKGWMKMMKSVHATFWKSLKLQFQPSSFFIEILECTTNPSSKPHNNIEIITLNHHGLGIILGESCSKLLLHCTKRGFRMPNRIPLKDLHLFRIEPK